jgi:hypothetical protein
MEKPARVTASRILDAAQHLEKKNDHRVSIDPQACQEDVSKPAQCLHNISLMIHGGGITSRRDR